jgi:glycine/D-amino acid oxidase-like deaminating enzyme
MGQAQARRGIQVAAVVRFASTLPEPVKICIVGAGGIGATLAARLALAGHDVCVLARNAHLQAIQAQGLRLVDLVNQVEHTVKLLASRSRPNWRANTACRTS